MSLLNMLGSVVTTLRKPIMTKTETVATTVNLNPEPTVATTVNAVATTRPATVATTGKQSVATVATTGKAMTFPRSSADLPEDVRVKAGERLLFLQKVSEMKQMNSSLTDPQAVMETAIRWRHLFPTLTGSGQRGKSQLTYNNYRNWKERLKGITDPEKQLLALADNYKRGYQDRLTGKYQNFMVHFNRLYMHENRQSIAECWRNARDTFAKQGIAEIPSLAQVRFYVQHLPKDVIIRTREGEVAWRNRCADYAERDWQSIPAGHMVIGDSRPFDTMVRTYDHDGKLTWAKPTLTALMDARSWRFISWLITIEPVSAKEQIMLLAQYCCITGGHAPAEAYFDNGKDYQAQGFATPMKLAGKEYSIFRALGIKLTTANPYNGRAKTIEPNFKNVKERFDKKWAAYLGGNIIERPDAAAYFEKHPEELPDLNIFCRVFTDWVNAYHRDPKNGVIHQGRSPEEVWNDRKFATRQMSPGEMQEAFMFPFGIREVGRGGRVSVEGRYYITDHVRYGEKVIVKTNVFQDNMVGLYDLTGRRIGTAYTREAVSALARGNDYELAKLEERMARQRAEERNVRLLSTELMGGRKNASPIEEMLTEGTGAKMITRGEVRTVKGHNHVYKRIAPKDDVLGALEEAKEEAAEEKKVLSDGSDQSDWSDRESDRIEEFHKFITHNKGEDDYE